MLDHIDTISRLVGEQPDLAADAFQEALDVETYLAESRENTWMLWATNQRNEDGLNMFDIYEGRNAHG